MSQEIEVHTAETEAKKPVPHFDMNKYAAKLLLQEPFFAALSRRIDKRESRAIPTAGVRVNPDTGAYEMLYNPEFFGALSEVERLGVLKHELYHLIFEHCSKRMPEGKMSKTWNVATDLAINSHLMNELPDVALFPGKGEYEGWPAGESAEWYYNKLKAEGKDQDQNGQGNGDGADSFDDHSGWGADSQEQEIAAEKMKETIKKAAEEAAKSNNWGTVSSKMKQWIKDNVETKIDWRKVLRSFVKASVKADKMSSIKKINRRYPYIHSGKKTSRLANIAISIDQSGSVSDSMLAAFYAELDKLASIASFTVIPFDTEVAEDKVFTWKKGERKKHERVLTGGTCFDAPTKYVNQRNFDGHIVLTDMCAPKPVNSKCQRMWMTTKQYASYKYFEPNSNERVIAIDEK